MEEMQSWRSALTRATNLSGWDSKNYQDDAKLMEDIVEDIFNKLIHISAIRDDGLVGMDSHINEMEMLLCPGVADVRFVGIWGMGGIGKTTIARAVYNKIDGQFEHCCFLENIKERFRATNGDIHMQEELLSRMLKEERWILGTLDKGLNLIRERLGKKKVLLVLDDVDRLDQIETLLGKKPSFGGGSRIIITTRDKHLLGGFQIYNPKLLSNSEALELFRQYAFRTNEPSISYIHLSGRAIEYAHGVPLALKVLGAFLDNKSAPEWEDQLEKIKRFPVAGIHGALRTSFDGLDDSQKSIFLDIACFFRGMHKDFVTKFLDSCGFFPHSGLGVLVDRALITISYYDTLEMHDLLQEMGWAIGRLSRVWSYEDVDHVLSQNVAREALEGIVLDLRKSKEVYLNTEAFVSMPKLRLLKLDHNRYTTHRYDYKFFGWYDLDHPALDEDCKQYVSGELKFLSHELRLLIWHGSPLKSLPGNFHPKNLVYLDMPHCHLEQLWEGIKPLKNLKYINLSHSQYLRKLPDLTEATNLNKVILDGCISLLEVHSSISALKHLVCLNLKGCKELKGLLSSIHMNSLELLDLSGCSNLEEFPEISEVMKELSDLNLDGTAIKELPSSIELLPRLATLSMRNCRSLVCVPDNICHLASLEELCLAGCSKLSNLPENLGNLKCLWKLEVEGSGLKQLPFSILCLSHLIKSLSCKGCKEMTAPFSLWPTWIQENPSYSVLLDLDLSDCNLLELSDGIACLSSLKSLNLCRNKNLESLPATMNLLGNLTQIALEGCKRLKSIPVLSSSIIYIDAHDCTALETVSTPMHLYNNRLCFTFSNCRQLVQIPFADIVENRSRHQDNLRPVFCRMHLSGSRVPDWFNHQCSGTSVTLQLPHNKILGFAVCAVSNLEQGALNFAAVRSALCICTFIGNRGQHSFGFQLLDGRFRADRFFESDHIFVGYKIGLTKQAELDDECYYTEATFRIAVDDDGVSTNDFRTVKDYSCIRSCGVRVLHFNNEEVQNLSTTPPITHADRSTLPFFVDLCEMKSERKRVISEREEETERVLGVSGEAESSELREGRGICQQLLPVPKRHRERHGE